LHVCPTGLIIRGRNAIFGHVARLPDNTPAHQAMLRQVELSVGRPPDPSWKRPPGRPRAKWIDQLRRENYNVPTATPWRQAIGRGHSRATLRSEPTTRRRRRRFAFLHYLAKIAKRGGGRVYVRCSHESPCQPGAQIHSPVTG